MIGPGLFGLTWFRNGVWSGKRRQRPTPPTPEELPPDSSLERRGTIRREGIWLKVFLIDTQAPDGLLVGHAIDYHSRGLGLLLFREVAVGQSFAARFAHAPDTVPWIKVVVSYCQQLDKTTWKVGCRSAEGALWNPLL